MSAEMRQSWAQVRRDLWEGQPNWSWLLWKNLSCAGQSRPTFEAVKRSLEVLIDAELEVVKTLALDGWEGTLDEIINAAKELA